jgi:hypothetical protein
MTTAHGPAFSPAPAFAGVVLLEGILGRKLRALFRMSIDI